MSDSGELATLSYRVGKLIEICDRWESTAECILIAIGKLINALDMVRESIEEENGFTEEGLTSDEEDIYDPKRARK